MQQVWVSGGGDIDAGTRVTVTATTNPGYLFIGWCEGDDIVSVDKDYTFTMPDGVRVLEARWVLGRYTVTFNSNGGSEVASITELYTNAIEAPTPPTRTGYTFAGWYSNVGLTSEYAFNTMPAENITVYAKWTKNRHNVNLSKNILAAGTVSENVVNAEYGTSVTVTASTKTGYTFDGWYEGETRVSTDASWTFYMPAAHKNYEARWTVYQRVDSEGVRSDSGAYILFGYYPQTRARVVSPSLSATTGNMGEYG